MILKSIRQPEGLPRHYAERRGNSIAQGNPAKREPPWDEEGKERLLHPEGVPSFCNGSRSSTLFAFARQPPGGTSRGRRDFVLLGDPIPGFHPGLTNATPSAFAGMLRRTSQGRKRKRTADHGVAVLCISTITGEPKRLVSPAALQKVSRVCDSGRHFNARCRTMGRKNWPFR